MGFLFTITFLQRQLIFKEVADIKTADMLDLIRPKMHLRNIAVPPTEHQKAMVQSLAERAEAVRKRLVEPSQDNMLKITNDGRKLALDQRLIDPTLPDDPNSKVNACVNEVFDTWLATKENKLTQLVFCDLSTPKYDGTFNVYTDIRQMPFPHRRCMVIRKSYLNCSAKLRMRSFIKILVPYTPGRDSLSRVNPLHAHLPHG